MDNFDGLNMSDPFKKMLLKAHAIEVAGEATYRVAARYARNEEAKQKWLALAKLELQMRDQLLEALVQMQATPRGTRLHAVLGGLVGWVAAQLPWAWAVWGMAHVTRHATQYWARMHGMHAEKNPQLMQALLAHEVAQETFAKHEKQGQEKLAMQAIKAVLRAD